MALKICVSIVGIRPNFVKLAALHGNLSQNFEHIIVHTGQHYDYNLSKVFFECLEIPEPNHNLEVGSGSHGYQLGEMVKRIESVLLKEGPDLVIVYGDANSTLAGALATVKLHTKIAHVEAGARNYDKSLPEEVNRLLTDQISDFLFCPTKRMLRNLRKENVQGKIYLTGDVMVDVLLKYKEVAEEKSCILEKLALLPKTYLLVTIHRERNTRQERLGNIIKALLELKEVIVFPLHPRTKEALQRFGLFKELAAEKNIVITEPLNYLDCVKLEKNALKILTDSGGIQKESYILGIPCIILRQTTEVVEPIVEGWSILVDEPSRIATVVEDFNPKGTLPRESLGKGDASAKIVDILKTVKFD